MPLFLVLEESIRIVYFNKMICYDSKSAMKPGYTDKLSFKKQQKSSIFLAK